MNAAAPAISSAIDDLDRAALPQIPRAVRGALLIVALIFLATLPSLASSWIAGDRAFAGLRQPQAGILLPAMPLYPWPRTAPVAALLALTERAAFGDAAPGWRIVSLALHVAVVLSLWLLLRRLAVPGAWLAAAIFALHPVQVEPVAAVHGQDVLLSGLFYVWAILVYLRCQVIGRPARIPPSPSAPRPQRATFFQRMSDSRIALFAIVLILGSCASLASSLGASLAFVLAALLWYRRGRLTSRELLELGHVAVLTITFAVVAELATPAGAPTPTLTLAAHFYLPVQAVAFYVENALMPTGHLFLYPEWPLSYIIQSFVLLALVFFILVALLTQDRFGRGPATLGILLALLALPAAIAGQTVVADRTTYFVVAAVAVAVAGIIHALAPFLWHESPCLARTPLAIVVLLFLAVLFHARAGLYSADNLLWNEVLVRYPDLPQALHARAAAELLDPHGQTAAEEDFRLLLDTNPHDPTALLGLARVAEHRKAWSEAISLLYQASASAPSDTRVLNALASEIERGGGPDGALDEYKKVLPIDPDNPVALEGIGRIETAREHAAEASAALERATDANPWYALAWVSLGELHLRQGRRDDAEALFDRACEADPTLPDAWLAAGSFYSQIGQNQQAAYRLRRAVALAPTAPEPFFQLGLVLDAMNDPNAFFCMRQAAALDPTNTGTARRAQDLQQKYFPNGVQGQQGG